MNAEPPVPLSDLNDLVDRLIDGKYLSLPDGPEGLPTKLRELADKLESRSKGLLRHSVGMSIFLNDTVTQSVQTMRSIREMSQRMATISASTEEMVATVQAISRTSELAASNAHSVQDISDEGARSNELVVSTMRDMVVTVNDTAERVARLSETSASIGAIVKQIEQIARQTNLLALNATIEAARAGEAGKGFAVVANEVKALANQTATATTDIRDRIGGLKAETDAILAGMEQGAEAVRQGEQAVLSSVGKMRQVSEEIRDVTALMQEIADHLGQQRQAAQEIASNLELATERSKSDTDSINKLIDTASVASASLTDMLTSLIEVEMKNAVILLAKSDHMVWRRRLAEMLVDRAKLNPHELANHHQCRLGKWYDQVQDASMKSHPAFLALEAPHKRVHDMGIQAAQLYADGKFEDAVELVAAIEEPSKEVQRLLDELAAVYS
ncbi:Methyl-accepting chemotaxis protein [Magnetospirillum sp. LM-5]|uniref:methyl-accepting chemotaxis protein n=1 Tax=Magnetospirillum sp. LM-5 TaxID=2681466 RepID=UPI00138011F6|nr:methyl-accepting chemotaxis protein [Magnetospirillum sp. LM-5]CAA7614259.1 Methyl-accepting chemotaxis protein [Magnetospirillum sp. LM-5]